MRRRGPHPHPVLFVVLVLLTAAALMQGEAGVALVGAAGAIWLLRR